MKGPRGFDRDIDMPADVDNPPGSDNEWAPWPGTPGFKWQSNGPVNGTRTEWVGDPLAPPFIQDGEVLLGQYDEGSTVELTVKLIETVTSFPIAGASVTLLNASDNTPAATGTSSSDGTLILSVDAGGVYYVKTEGTDHFPQVSDEFQLIGNHMWTMVLTPGAANGGGLSRFILWLGILLLLLLLLITIWYVISRRQPSP